MQDMLQYAACAVIGSSNSATGQVDPQAAQRAAHAKTLYCSTFFALHLQCACNVFAGTFGAQDVIVVNSATG